jgi:hypothetical protein
MRPNRRPSDTAGVAGDEPGAQVAQAPAESQGGPEAEVDIAMIDPAADVPVAAEPGTDSPVAVAEADAPPMAVPTFDIVRVEVTGDTVIAGQGEPNAIIEIMDGPTVIATAEANEVGEWVIALDEPLAPGSHDLAISTTTPDGAFVTLSDERVTVSVPEDGSGDVLVVLSLPDAPSAVLQIPSVATPEPEVAVVEEPAAEDHDVAAVAPDSGDGSGSDRALRRAGTRGSRCAGRGSAAGRGCRIRSRCGRRSPRH